MVDMEICMGMGMPLILSFWIMRYHARLLSVILSFEEIFQ